MRCLPASLLIHSDGISYPRKRNGTEQREDRTNRNVKQNSTDGHTELI